MQSEQFIQQLIKQTKQIINETEQLKSLSENVLKTRPKQESWNILECLEHLNLYGDYYFPEIESTIQQSKPQKDSEFKSGFLGSYFSKSMMPKEQLNKMKTFKTKNPLNEKLDIQTIDRFINQQIKLIDLLNQSRNFSLNKVKIKTSISELLKLKLGDTYQFIVNHNLRHLQQIKNIKKEISGF
jgi:hypothetical protein